MNRCQHTDEQMNDNEEAVNDNMSDKTAKQREREREKERRRDGGGRGEGGDRNRPKIKRNTGEVKHLLWCLHVSFFPRNKTKWMN